MDICIHWETSLGRGVMCSGNEESEWHDRWGKEMYAELGCLSINNGCRYRRRWLLF